MNFEVDRELLSRIVRLVQFVHGIHLRPRQINSNDMERQRAASQDPKLIPVHKNLYQQHDETRGSLANLSERGSAQHMPAESQAERTISSHIYAGTGMDAGSRIERISFTPRLTRMILRPKLCEPMRRSPLCAHKPAKFPFGLSPHSILQPFLSKCFLLRLYSHQLHC